MVNIYYVAATVIKVLEYNIPHQSYKVFIHFTSQMKMLNDLLKATWLESDKISISPSSSDFRFSALSPIS